MTNGEKYKTAHERAEAFRDWCGKRSCDDCIMSARGLECGFAWLDLEAEEEKPETIEDIVAEMRSNTSHSAADAFYGVADWKRLCDRILAAHNRVAEKCREVVE